jgi:transcriptional repressor NrdR
MKCPFCRTPTTEVYNSRTTKFGNQIWRRRRCNHCHESFTTYESANLGFLKVRHRQKNESFSRATLYASIAKAFPSGHRESVVDAITDTIEAKLLDSRKRVLEPSSISHVVLATLKAYDKAAFLRYLADHENLTSATNLLKQLGQY